MKSKLLYLDVDGVLLGKKHPADIDIVLANYAEEFLKHCLQNYKCYWLTTHCKNGEERAVINELNRYANNSVMELVKQIKATSWNVLKTEAIDFASDFYWIDDQLIYSEIEVLRQNDSLNRWIRIDTRSNPDDLKLAIKLLEKRASKK